MADYYPLIARAVASLETNTGEARRALYERSRTALVAELRGVTPALSDSDVTRECLALEEAVRKVEAESVRQTFVKPTRTTTPVVPPWEEPLAPPPDRHPHLPADIGASLRTIIEAYRKLKP